MKIEGINEFGGGGAAGARDPFVQVTTKKGPPTKKTRKRSVTTKKGVTPKKSRKKSAPPVKKGLGPNMTRLMNLMNASKKRGTWAQDRGNFRTGD